MNPVRDLQAAGLRVALALVVQKLGVELPETSSTKALADGHDEDRLSTCSTSSDTPEAPGSPAVCNDWRVQRRDAEGGWASAVSGERDDASGPDLAAAEAPGAALGYGADQGGLYDWIPPDVEAAQLGGAPLAVESGGWGGAGLPPAWGAGSEEPDGWRDEGYPAPSTPADGGDGMGWVDSGDGGGPARFGAAPPSPPPWY